MKRQGGNRVKYSEMSLEKMYACWLDERIMPQVGEAWPYGKVICIKAHLLEKPIIQTALGELTRFIKSFQCSVPKLVTEVKEEPHLAIELIEENAEDLADEGYTLAVQNEKISVRAKDERGILYGVFKLIFLMKRGQLQEGLYLVDAPNSPIRMINHWDNVDGSIERGYAGGSIFYKDNAFIKDKRRVRDYARLLASVGINAININNVNVHYQETHFMTDLYLDEIAELAHIFESYGIQLFMSINFAAPLMLSDLGTADPLDEGVRAFWKEHAKKIYEKVPHLGGFLVKADSENRPGPFTYGRTHAEGANMLAEAIAPYGGLVIWRCFVYNCHVDWRDRKTDRARAAYDHFIGLDGQFAKNVVLQIKNGPMDFQIREPLSPLFGALKATNTILEFQITQEYTGQQKHICFLPSMWRECLDFDTYGKGKGTYMKDLVSGKVYGNTHAGIAGVVNIGDSVCWTGSPMAAANLYGFGRLCWDGALTPEEIAREWTELTLGCDEAVVSSVMAILLDSRKAYEDYTVPLGIGWMVNVGHHYGPNIEGYEYSPWGTYHYADYKGIGVDRTDETGTGYVSQYFEPNRSLYNNRETCPEELLLFFHHVGYDEKLKDGRTLLQYIYDVHFEGVEKVEQFITLWDALEGKVETQFYETVKSGLREQYHDAIEWRDIVNTYFYRKTGVGDMHGRKIYV